MIYWWIVLKLIILQTTYVGFSLKFWIMDPFITLRPIIRCNVIQDQILNLISFFTILIFHYYKCRLLSNNTLIHKYITSKLRHWHYNSHYNSFIFLSFITSKILTFCLVYVGDHLFFFIYSLIVYIYIGYKRFRYITV